MTKVYFPRLLLPGSCVFGSLIDLAVSAVIFFGMMAYYHLHLSENVLILPALLLLVTLLTIAVGMWTSALYVKYRDIRYALPFVLQLWMYVTPVIYPANFIPERFRWLLDLNPMSGVIEGFRSAFLGRPLPGFSLAVAAVMTAILLFGAAYSFRRMEREMADII